MTLSERERERLADVVALQPTKNAELAERWGMDGGGEVHRYLEDHLEEHYYRDENSLIRATTAAADLVDVEPGVEGDGDDVDVVRVPPLQARVVDVLPGPEDDPASVVATLHAVWDVGVDADVDAVRTALWSLRDKGVVEVVQRVVPTFRLALPRADLSVEERAELSDRNEGAGDGSDGERSDSPDSGSEDGEDGDGDEILDRIMADFEAESG